MAYIILDNPAGCCNKDKLKKFESCWVCYCSQVNEKNQWRGSQKCWDSQCLKYGGNK